MKHLNKKFLYFLVALMFTSCLDDDALEFHVDKPQDVALLEQLNQYDALKSYVDRSENPMFKLGAGTSLSEYNSKGAMFRLLNSNFDEITIGHEMKHASIVQNDGSFNLSDVEDLYLNASEAGMSVYGHTLVWHSGQNAEYLNSTIAPTVVPGTGDPTWDVVTSADFETDDESNYEYNENALVSFTADGTGANDEGRALKIINEEVRENEWDSQFFITFSPAMEVGEQYQLTMDVRAEHAASIPTQAHSVPYDYLHYEFFGAIEATTEWSSFSRQITITEEMANAGTIAFNLGNTATSYYFDNVVLSKYNEEGSGGPTWDLITLVDFETDDDSNYTLNENAIASFTADGEGADGQGRAIQVINEEVRDEEWQSQFFVVFSAIMEVGEQFELTMDIRANEPAGVATQAQAAPFEYLHWDFFGTLQATTEWSTYSRQITVTEEMAGAGTIAFNLGNTATTYYFDNIAVSKYNEDDGSSQTIEKTPEEKEEIIDGELERWISEMMEVSSDYVQAWDVVNEPMDDGNPFEIKSGVGRDLAEDEFFWQDYLGKEYAVKAFKYAMEYGNEDDILFINDYNLEYNLDKCRGLIEFVEYLENEGARVDGIGTQMHISIDSDKDKIIAMFELLAETGKLIKVSELDIGVGALTRDATDEDYIAQAEMYRFVVEQYFEIIPASQRYGITVWSPIDSPANSSWRADEPIGLWNSNLNRKRSYAGFANGLAGKNISDDF